MGIPAGPDGTVGLNSAELICVDPIFPNLVIHDPLRRTQKDRRATLVAFGALESIHNQDPFVGINTFFEIFRIF